MRIASVEVVPYALPFREPYVTARGTLERREMVLLRLRDEDGLVGLGEAVPLSLRGGARSSRSSRSWRGSAGRDGARRGDAAAAGAAALSPPARCAALTALLDLAAGERDGGVDAAERGSDASACNATLVAGEPAAVAADARRWAAEGFTTFKLKLGGRRRRRPGAGGARGARARGADPGRRQRRLGRWTRRSATLAELEPFEIELAEQPVADDRGGGRARGIDLDPARRRREHRDAARRGAGCAHGRLPPDRDQALQGRRDRPGGDRDRRDPARLRLERARRPGRDRRRGAGRADAAADAAGPATPELAHGLATQRLFASTDRRGRVRAPRRHARTRRTGPASASRSTRTRSTRHRL